MVQKGVVVLLLALLAYFLPTFLNISKKFLKNNSEHIFSEVARISYSDLLNSNPDIDPTLLHSMKQYGFFYVVDIPSYNASLELDYLQRFFDLPDHYKLPLAVRKHNPHNVNVYRGYGPVVGNVGTQYKEVFNIGPHETHPPYNDSHSDLQKLRSISRERNVWPNTDNPQFDRDFKSVMKSGFDLRLSIARAIVESISRALDFPGLPALFTEHEFSTLGLRKYPVRKRINSDMYSEFDGVLLKELEHVDSTVTVLSTFNNTGLQMLYKDKYWEAPVSGDNCFIINIGKLIEDITGNQIISVRHRVIEIPETRYSIPFFYNPSFDSDISRSMTGQVTEAGQKYRIFGEWMKDYLPAVEPGLLQQPTPSVSSDNTEQYSTDQLDDTGPLTLARLALD
uniref:Putative isopenicillin-n-synthase n=1 Tax=Ctenophora sp. C WRF-2014 TaxID=1567049 RepID=A0A0A0RZN0_9METZ|nr:putative isopenicillin-n-synthase [Ctenophora sp. C WRF-2014]